METGTDCVEGIVIYVERVVLTRKVDPRLSELQCERGSQVHGQEHSCWLRIVEPEDVGEEASRLVLVVGCDGDVVDLN